MTVSDTTRCRYSVFPSKDLESSEALLMYSFSSWNTVLYSAVYIKCIFLLFRALKNSAHRSVAFEINLVRAATRLVRLWMFFYVCGHCMSTMALIFLGWPWFPCGWSWSLRLPKRDTECAFPEIQPYSVFLRFQTWLPSYRGDHLRLAFHQYVIHVNLHDAINMYGENSVDQTLVGCSGILQAEWHYIVAI